MAHHKGKITTKNRSSVIFNLSQSFPVVILPSALHHISLDLSVFTCLSPCLVDVFASMPMYIQIIWSYDNAPRKIYFYKVKICEISKIFFCC